MTVQKYQSEKKTKTKDWRTASIQEDERRKGKTARDLQVMHSNETSRSGCRVIRPFIGPRGATRATIMPSAFLLALRDAENALRSRASRSAISIRDILSARYRKNGILLTGKSPKLERGIGVDSQFNAAEGMKRLKFLAGQNDRG
jgi:hypothetical protein